jgi:hypothetical protein
MGSHTSVPFDLARSEGERLDVFPQSSDYSTSIRVTRSRRTVLRVRSNGPVLL